MTDPAERPSPLRLVPYLACLVVHWHGLWAWFQMDDFYWLSMPAVARQKGLLRVLTSGTDQGSWRPLAEPALFLSFSALFGLHALPYRLLVMSTQMVNLALLASLARRLWQSETAGWVAALLWTVNATLVLPMVWTSSYNQILGATAALGSLVCLDCWLQHGRRRDFFAATAAFAVGLLALQTLFMLPLVAAVWIAVRVPRERCARLVAWLVPWAAISAAFLLLHHSLAVPRKSGPYIVHLDSTVFVALLRYWRWSLVATHFTDRWPISCELALGAGFTAALAWFVVARQRGGDWRPWFGLAFFLLMIAPLLPFSEHQTDYYATVPTIGLAILAGGAVAGARAARWRWSGWGLAAVYFLLMAPWSYVTGRGIAGNSRPLAQIFPALIAARRSTTAPIVLTDVSEAVYDFALGHKALRFLGLSEVYLDRAASDRLRPPAFLPAPAVLTPPASFGGRVPLLLSLAGNRVTEVPRP